MGKKEEGECSSYHLTKKCPFQEGKGDFLSTITACNNTKAKQLINIFGMQ